jgi:hypothetical protein
MGVITRIFDNGMFPTPPELRGSYQVTDEKSGKLINLPHPVEQMRIWSPMERRYEEYDCHLVGAPREGGESEEYWAKMIAELKEKRGSDYIEGLLN